MAPNEMILRDLIGKMKDALLLEEADKMDEA